MLNDDDYYDVTFEVGNDSRAKIFRVILRYRSMYFQRILSTNERKNDGTLVNISESIQF
ncbi:hypothetical protein RhiirC2_763094 [Rhizophagus irregularis]|uniref:BTB domain-containing protein n=1 Tax=Rhizophagus irregularis TaxID=588596 RepID=A0A2N1MB52_9GLOM|nr:hypothetical protein RhiirC2_763094 [Rhizophagus irregularis]